MQYRNTARLLMAFGMAAIWLIPFAAQGQEKVGTLYDPATSFQNYFYAANFTDAAAIGRGSLGLAFPLGAKSILANPANLGSTGRYDIYMEGSAFRSSIRPLSPILPTENLEYSQPEARFNLLAVSARLRDRVWVGLAASQKTNFRANLSSAMYYSSYEYTDSVPDAWVSASVRTTVHDFAGALAAEPYRGVRVGLSAGVTRYDVFDEETFTDLGSGNPIFETTVNDNYYVPLIIVGASAQAGDISLGTSFRWNRNFTISRTTEPFHSTFDYKVIVPKELAIGAGFRRILSADFKTILPGDNLDKVYEYGVGLGLPLSKWFSRQAGTISAGVFHREGGELIDIKKSQWFLTAGLELSFARYSLSAALIDGHLLTDDNQQVSEFLFGFGYSIP